MGNLISALIVALLLTGLAIFNHIRCKGEPMPPDGGDAASTISFRANATPTSERDW